MSSRLVDGVAVPEAVGGDPALDFANTRAGWGSAEAKEYLTSGRALGVWVREAELLPGEDLTALLESGLTRSAEQALLRRTWALRDSLYGCLMGHARRADWLLVGAEAKVARSASRLVPIRSDLSSTPAGPAASWQLDAQRLPPGRAALASIAVAEERLLTSPLAGCVAACPGAGCGWLFADPRRRRRWCSMAVCGNRAKARRFADRTASPGAM